MDFVKKNQSDMAALLLRVGFGFFIVFGHGYGKLANLLAGNTQFPALFGLPPVVNLGLAIFGELICGILVILGIRTKISVIPLIAVMLVALIFVHGGDPLFMAGAKGGSKEFAFIYLIGFLGIFFSGSGKYSVDNIFYKKK